jgi:hypothetical protein
MEGQVENLDDHREPDETDERDACTKAGADRIAKKIEAYWAARGRPVQTRIWNVGFVSATRCARHDVRSDMVNGLPRPLPSSHEEAA